MDELNSDLKDIENVYINRDLSTFIQIIHKLHGSLCYCGAPRLKATIKNIETILKSGAIHQWDTLYPQFLSEVKALQEAFVKI